MKGVELSVACKANGCENVHTHKKRGKRCCWGCEDEKKMTCLTKDAELNQNEAQSARAESTHKGVNYRSKYVTQVQQSPET